MTGRDAELTALLIAPDRELARQFSKTLASTRAFQILADSKSYFAEQALGLRIKQLSPDVLLLDASTSLDEALTATRYVAANHPDTLVVCLHTRSDADALVKVLRAGASEFLYAPFDSSIQREAVNRLRRLKQPEQVVGGESATVISFASTKPGSGSSTLAAHTAFALRRKTGKRVLLADFDLMGGVIGFYVKVRHHSSLIDALDSSERMDASFWAGLTVTSDGVDVLPAPEDPATPVIDSMRLHEVIENARRYYDWIVLDLPVIFSRTSLLCVSESDRSFLVSTSELPSLHLTRRAIASLGNLGFDRHRYQVIVNRVSKRDGFVGNDLEKMFNCSVFATLPNDYFALHRVVTLGEPLGNEGELGKAIESMANRLSGAVAAEKRKTGGGPEIGRAHV